MSEDNNIGKYMALPLDSIESREKSNVPNFLIIAAAENLKQSEERNWQPLIVKPIAKYRYEVVSNVFVYDVSREANLERVWCIVVDPSHQQVEQAKILSKEITPKINFNKASSEVITSAINYLINDRKLLPKTVKIENLANADRENISAFSEVANLKCSISKVKCRVLEEIFFLEPKPAIELPPAPEIVSIKKASHDEIFERINYLYKHKISGFEKLDPEQLTDIIFNALKTKWKSLNPITKLECGIDTKKLKILKKYFTL